MLKVGGGALDIWSRAKRGRKFLDHAHLGATDAARPLWQEFLDCSNEETNGKSIRTDYIDLATYSWNFKSGWTDMALAVGTLPPFPAGWGGGTG